MVTILFECRKVRIYNQLRRLKLADEGEILFDGTRLKSLQSSNCPRSVERNGQSTNSIKIRGIIQTGNSMQRSFVVFAILATSLGFQSVANAQSPFLGVPNDVNNPALDFGDPNGRADIPTRLNGIVLPEVSFLFDGLLDPQRISLIEAVTSGSVNDERLTLAARSLIRNHLIAMQQVELAIRFLQANRGSILSGNNGTFNRVFGNPGDLRDVAVVAPTPVSATATVQIDAMTGQIDLQFNGTEFSNVSGDIKVGDFIYIGDAPNSDPDGFVLEVEEIVVSPDGQTQAVLGTSTFGGALTTANQSDISVYKVVSFEQQTDPARFERVLQTFTAIRDSLQGLDTTLNPSLQTINDITYQRRFEDINTVWAPGVAQFAALDQIVQRELGRTGLTSTATTDRLFRQAGLSNSDSHFHIDRLDDQGFDQAIDYQGRATFPLLWTEDNELPLNVGVNSIVTGASDEDRAFFRDRQTIFGEPDNPFTQYIGRAFLEETIVHDGAFLDDAIAVEEQNLTFTFNTTFTQGGTVFTTTTELTDDLILSAVQATRPIRGPIVDLDGNPLTADQDFLRTPESGIAKVSQTELRKWQLIIESFAERSTDLELFDVATIGLAGIFGDFVPDDLRTRDAGNFAKFAALIGGGDGGLGTIDVNRIEPFGKRGSAGFNPVVPRN